MIRKLIQWLYVPLVLFLQITGLVYLWRFLSICSWGNSVEQICSFVFVRLWLTLVYLILVNLFALLLLWIGYPGRLSELFGKM